MNLMEAEQVMKLYDSYWFELQILNRQIRRQTSKLYESYRCESPMKVTRGRRRKRSKRRSLSDLQLEELKGFMDLGIVFSQVERDSYLASIIPGLQRLGMKDDDGQKHEGFDESTISRPYLSEAWEVRDRKEKEKQLMNWRFPALSNEIDMKDNLRLWAHTVASTVII